ncbi:MAG: glutamate formimidoyltransferase [Thermoplasmata archaeon]|nr:glutamate formimidoyltransferase [Thermoplasmata archaeon]
MSLFECVPNFSEGRDVGTIDALAAAARGVDGVTVLDVERNADHNRCVISLVGDGLPLEEAIVRMARIAVERIDLNHHRGEHPRMGAVDVVPFVPLGATTMAEAVARARSVADRLWKELQMPVYLYGQAALRPDHEDLSAVRKGEFEGIRDSIGTDPVRAPDVGAPAVHPTAGIVAVGARPVLIAYNAYLTTPDVAVAKKIAKVVRARDGGLPAVKALGFEIAERNQAQVSMNLIDYHVTPIHVAFEAVRREAARLGTEVDESEIVGLVPEDALFDAAESYLALKHFDRGTVLERKLRAARGAGPAPTGRLEESSLATFTDRLAARTPTPGGGSAAAAAGALATALAQMVLAYSHTTKSPHPELVALGLVLGNDRAEFLAAVDDDAVAYEGVRTARKRRAAEPGNTEAHAAWKQAVRHAAEVPLAVARRARSVADRLRAVQPSLNPNVTSDFVTSVALLDAARVGALANVRVNLDELRQDGTSVAEMEQEAARLAMGR